MNAKATDFHPSTGFTPSHANGPQVESLQPNRYDVAYEETHLDPYMAAPADVYAYSAEDPAIHDGAYYAPQADHGFLTPLPSLKAPWDDPVTALCYSSTYSAIHVASAAKPLGTTRFKEQPHRASMLSTQSTVDGSVYSSVAGHPQAAAEGLTQLYAVKYGVRGATSASSTAYAKPRGTVPSHAYRPYYSHGANAARSLESSATASSKGLNQQYQMGIHSLQSLAQGHVSSVSPSGVRVHTHGGYQVSDCHLEGLLCGTRHPNSGISSDGAPATTHLTVGGRLMESGGTSTTNNSRNHHLVCLDIWQGLRTIASQSLSGRQSSSTSHTAVTTLATNQTHGSLLAGCSDGTLRLLDGSLRPLACISTSHLGGVEAVAVSEDGTLIATTGFGAHTRTNDAPLYAFPDPMVLVYDIRYLGRGGIPHPFAGVRGGPKYLTFLPAVEGLTSSNRLLVASGLSGGGMQIVEPFQEASDNSASFILPPLHRDSITSLTMEEDILALGTSSGIVLQYRLEGYTKPSLTGRVSSGVFVPRASTTLTKPSSYEVVTDNESVISTSKQPLVPPSFAPPLPALSMGPELLQGPEGRKGANERSQSIFSAFILARDPTVSYIGDATNKHLTSFGDLALHPMVSPSRLKVSPKLLNRATQSIDFLKTIKSSDLDVNLLEDLRSEQTTTRFTSKTKPALPNANKLMHSEKVFHLAYEESLNRTKKLGRRGRREGTGDNGTNSSLEEEIRIPDRYRLALRQAHKTPTSFNHSAYNETSWVPGWDYAATMPNAFIPPVLLLMYFMPEMRSIATSTLAATDRLQLEKNLMCELAFVFARVDNIARWALIHPTSSGNNSLRRVGAWAPTNFISCLAALKEAEQLQILDGSPAAVSLPQRPEAFFRFLLYHIDKEAVNLDSDTRLDEIVGATFLSANEFNTGSNPPSQTTTRAMTIELYYDNFLVENRSSVSHPTFAAVLQKTLYRETRLRAWSSGSKTYETIVQRKVVTSLPKILSLACCCAGRDPNEGLCLWRHVGDHGHFLPEWIEIEILESGGVIVRELMKNEQTGQEYWKEAGSESTLPSTITEMLRDPSNSWKPRKQKYRLDLVLSTVRDDLDRSPEVQDLVREEWFGHHVVHARLTREHEAQVLSEQCNVLQEMLSATSRGRAKRAFHPSEEEKLMKRLEAARADVAQWPNDAAADKWVAINSFVVSQTNVDDARAFHVRYKEPSLVIFRAVSEDEQQDPLPMMDKSLIPSKVMDTISLSNGSRSPLSSRQLAMPEPGDLLAFDAEFVSVGDEESILTESGSKVIVREMRYAVARISVIHCRTQAVILDDYVLPREPVVDYLTRFSGIVAKDLDPKYSPHHLISTRSAYLKLRYLMERGCIFIGHGLQMDFWTLNLTVPWHQVIDTVEIYHKPAQRFVSLRFLANFVLKRDMQQDVHDSVEDALAAYQLYEKAVALKEAGEFDKLLDDLYEFGFKTDWKLGVEDGEGTE